MSQLEILISQYVLWNAYMQELIFQINRQPRPYQKTWMNPAARAG
jgi:hypothetical protein